MVIFQVFSRSFFDKNEKMNKSLPLCLFSSTFEMDGFLGSLRLSVKVFLQCKVINTGLCTKDEMQHREDVLMFWNAVIFT